MKLPTLNSAPVNSAIVVPAQPDIPKVLQLAAELPLNYDHWYLQQRGIDSAWAQYLGVGEHANNIYWPVHDLYGRFVQYVPRMLSGEDPKYDFTGLSKARYLFNYHRARQAKRRAVIVVEGFFGVARVCQAGYMSSVALMGSAMSELQEQYLTRYWDYVVLLLDGDNAGRSATQEHSKRLKKHGLEVFAISLPDKIQPDHLSVTQLHELLAAPLA